MSDQGVKRNRISFSLRGTRVEHHNGQKEEAEAPLNGHF